MIKLEGKEINRFFLTLAYKGTNFFGWQKQSAGRTVQGTLEEGLSTILRQSVEVVGCGRTDSGVHASNYICHVDLPLALSGVEALVYRANRLLPKDLRIYGARSVHPEAHARFDAIARRYGYYVTSRPTPFGYELETGIPSTVLDYQSMNEAAQCLIGVHDFTTFSKGGTDVHTHICTVTEAEWVRLDEWRATFRYTSNRFLRNMVRATVGTLFDVGRGKLTPEDFRVVFESKDRSKASTSAPPEGLFLEEITYPRELYLQH